MTGYSQYTKAIPVLAVCLTKPPAFAEHFQARLPQVRVRGDEVAFCSLVACVASSGKYSCSKLACRSRNGSSE